MKHSYIQNNQIIEKYLLHQLNEDDTAAFEEHLLMCSECVNELKNMEIILTQAAKSRMNEVFSGKSARENKSLKFRPKLSLIYRMAASLLLIAGISVILFYIIKREHKSNDHIVNTTSSHADTTKQVLPDTIPANKIKHSSYIASGNKAFKPSSFYEPLVSNIYRYAGLKITEPVINYSNSEVVFSWTYMKNDSLFILLVNNTDSVIIKHRTISPYVCRKRLKPGLYYWQLQSEEELLYTGKLLIQPYN